MTVRRWESEKHKSWGIPVEGFRSHVATDGACGWSVVQLDHDKEMGPVHGMYGTREVELEVQCTINRA